MLLISISEPIEKTDNNPNGDHWTLGVVYFEKRTIVYYDSWKSPPINGRTWGRFESFKKASPWYHLQFDDILNAVSYAGLFGWPSANRKRKRLQPFKLVICPFKGERICLVFVNAM